MEIVEKGLGEEEDWKRKNWEGEREGLEHVKRDWMRERDLVDEGEDWEVKEEGWNKWKEDEDQKRIGRGRRLGSERRGFEHVIRD